jgi:hypothetical protein
MSPFLIETDVKILKLNTGLTPILTILMEYHFKDQHHFFKMSPFLKGIDVKILKSYTG